MIHITAQSNILLATKPIDFRKQIDGIVAVCKHNLSQHPHSGALFVFINKSRTMIRILCYEHNGYWLATKRLSKGRYAWPKIQEMIHPLQAQALTKLLKGGLLKGGLASN